MLNFLSTLVLLVKSYLSKCSCIFKLIFNSEVFVVYLQVNLIAIVYAIISQNSEKNYFSFNFSDSGLFRV